MADVVFDEIHLADLAPSCWNVAIFFESGDQSTGRSLRVQPALSVA